MFCFLLLRRLVGATQSRQCRILGGRGGGVSGADHGLRHRRLMERRSSVGTLSSNDGGLEFLMAGDIATPTRTFGTTHRNCR